MSNRELTYPEFEKMFLVDNIKALKAALGRTREKFFFTDLLYNKLIQTGDKEKTKGYISKKIY